MKNLKQYDDYREFLKDCFLTEKKSSKNTTLAQYSRRFGVSSASMNMIFSGSRNLTIEHLHRFAKVLKLSKAEHQYFEALVLRDQFPKNSSPYKYYDSKKQGAAQSMKMSKLRFTDRSLISNWMIPIILIYLIDFKDESPGIPDINPGKMSLIAKHLNISTAHVENLIEECRKTGLLHIDSDDRIHIEFNRIGTYLPQRNHVKSILENLASKIEENFEKDDSIYRAFVFTTQKSALPDFKTEINALFEKYMSMVSDDQAQNTIVQAGVGLVSVL